MKRDKLKIEMMPCVRAFIYRIEMPARDLKNLKRYATHALDNHTEYKDHSYTLAGRIKKGKQLLMPPEAKKLEGYYKMLNKAHKVEER